MFKIYFGILEKFYLISKEKQNFGFPPINT